MASITVRKQNEAPANILPAAAFDPFRMARSLLRWDPFQEIEPMFGAVEAQVFAPAFEVKENKDGYVFRADLPGVKEADLEISMTGNRLTIAGKREAEKEEQKETYYTYERTYGAFTRSFTLPEGIDVEHIRAELKEGVLNLVVPKLPEAQPKKIKLSETAKH